MTDEKQTDLQCGETAENSLSVPMDGKATWRLAPGSLVVPATVSMALFGGFLQGQACGTLDGVFLSLVALSAGVLLVSLLFRGRAQEIRAFLLSYGVCALAGGLAQSYALSAFGNPMNTPDAVRFLGAILEKPPYHTWLELRTVWTGSTFLGCGAPLAVATWQHVYRFLLWLGFDYGPYIGTLFNALLVGLSGSIAVRAARELFGNDSWRLRRVGNLHALCGIFVLFGALLLRDCFTLILNLLVLWGLIRWLRRPTLNNYAFALLLTAFAGLCILYLRERSIYLFGLFHMLALGCWYWRGEKALGHLAATIALPVAIILASAILLQYFNESLYALTAESDDYVVLAAVDSQEDSLGMALVVTQPMPVRAVLGSGVLLAFPIPLWTYLGPGVTEYQLLKTWQGIYKLFVLPLFFVGILRVVRDFRRKEKHSMPQAFIALYAVGMVVAVAATSLETRHLGQFFPAIILLAAIPDTRDVRDRRSVRSMTVLWIGVVSLVHMAWAGMRFL